MIVIWLIIGCVVVCAAFVLPGRSVELWPNLDAAGIVLLFYLAALLGTFYRSKSISPLRRNVVLIVAVIAILAASFTWWQTKNDSQWRRHKLGEIGTIIGRGIYTSMLSDSLLNVLDSYYHQGRRSHLSLGEIYKKRFPPGKIGDAWSSLAQTGMANPPDDVFLTAISDTQVVLVARHPWFRGQDTSFATYHGPRGTVQVRATLMEKGLDYVDEN